MVTEKESLRKSGMESNQTESANGVYWAIYISIASLAVTMLYYMAIKDNERKELARKQYEESNAKEAEEKRETEKREDQERQQQLAERIKVERIRAETERIKAEAEKIRAEAERIKAEQLKRQSQPLPVQELPVIRPINEMQLSEPEDLNLYQEISVDFVNTTLEEAIKVLVGNNYEVEKNAKIDHVILTRFKKTDKTIAEILTALLATYWLDWEIQGNRIIIRKKANQRTNTPANNKATSPTREQSCGMDLTRAKRIYVMFYKLLAANEETTGLECHCVGYNDHRIQHQYHHNHYGNNYDDRCMLDCVYIHRCGHKLDMGGKCECTRNNYCRLNAGDYRCKVHPYWKPITESLMATYYINAEKVLEIYAEGNKNKWPKK